MQALTFVWPYAGLLILALVPLLISHQRFAQQAYLKNKRVELVARLAPTIPKGGAKLPDLRLIVLWGLMVLALMRPQFVGEPIENARSGRSIMLTLDISESMEAQDMNISGQPFDRLSIAKSVIDDFIDHRKGDRLGLVLFGSESFLHAPLSFDHKMIKRFLADAQIGFLGPKTAIGEAIGLSVKKLMEQQATGDRIMVLLSDGQNNSGVLEPMQAAQLAKAQGIKIYIVGLGASQMIVDSFFGSSAVNPSQDLEAAEPELKKIAALTGGSYFRARDHNALAGIYNQIDRLEPIVVDNQVIVPKKELFYWPLGLAVLFMLGQLLAQRLKSLRQSS